MFWGRGTLQGHELGHDTRSCSKAVRVRVTCPHGARLPHAVHTHTHTRCNAALADGGSPMWWYHMVSSSWPSTTTATHGYLLRAHSMHPITLVLPCRASPSTLPPPLYFNFIKHKKSKKFDWSATLYRVWTESMAEWTESMAEWTESMPGWTESMPEWTESMPEWCWMLALWHILGHNFKYK